MNSQYIFTVIRVKRINKKKYLEQRACEITADLVFVSLVFWGWEGNPLALAMYSLLKQKLQELANRVLTHDMMAVQSLLAPEIRVWNTPDAGAIHPPEEGQQVRDCECP